MGKKVTYLAQSAKLPVGHPSGQSGRHGWGRPLDGTAEPTHGGLTHLAVGAVLLQLLLLLLVVLLGLLQDHTARS